LNLFEAGPADASADRTKKRDSASAYLLDQAFAAGWISSLDRQFARRVAEIFDARSDSIEWALALASRQEAAGHVCADLNRLAEEGIIVEVAGVVHTASILQTHDSLEAWLESLRDSELVQVGVLERDGKPRPLILDEQGRLYLSRAYRDECELADRLRQRAEDGGFELDSAWVEAAISRLAPGKSPGDEAARSALRVGLEGRIAIVTGGPGTGKTTMVARLIALLLEHADSVGERPPRVKLLAPTGKAAAALSVSLARGAASLGVPTGGSAAASANPYIAETIYRALHRQTRVDAFGRPEKIAIEADVVVVDEASMVDLGMMNRLFAACEAVPRVILLGDPDQLASVDSGAVLSELCAGRDSKHPLGVAQAQLTQSHRFSASSGIGRLAAAIREGDADTTLALLADPEHPEISRVDLESGDIVAARLVEQSHGLHDAIKGAAEMHEKLEQMAVYRVLCAHRKGPFGVETLSARLDDAGAAARLTRAQAGWWRGRLLLVTQNAPDQDLWNGDVGLVEETAAGLRALFPDGAGGVRAMAAGRLPSHESAIAMSIHKSQGSEFDFVDLVLGDFASPIMTRELFYTGVTRARTTLRVHASESAIRAMMGRRIQRDSGLAERLWAD